MKYGGWPRSGEIDLLEARGNLKYGEEKQIGVEQVLSTLHFGPNWDQDGYPTSGLSSNNESGYHNDFHKFELIWDEKGLKFLLDEKETGTIPVGDGFWQRGGFKGENIWKDASKMAPFDQEVTSMASPNLICCILNCFLFFEVPLLNQFGCRWILLPRRPK